MPIDEPYMKYINCCLKLQIRFSIIQKENVTTNVLSCEQSQSTNPDSSYINLLFSAIHPVTCGKVLGTITMATISDLTNYQTPRAHSQKGLFQPFFRIYLSTTNECRTII